MFTKEGKERQKELKMQKPHKDLTSKIKLKEGITPNSQRQRDANKGEQNNYAKKQETILSRTNQQNHR